LIATLLGRQGMAHARAFAGNVGIAAIADRLLRNGDPLVVSWNLTCPLYSFSSAESADVCVRGCLASHIFGGTCICGLWHTYTHSPLHYVLSPPKKICNYRKCASQIISTLIKFVVKSIIIYVLK
jgi:hypothetical protein